MGKSKDSTFAIDVQDTCIVVQDRNGFEYSIVASPYNEKGLIISTLKRGMRIKPLSGNSVKVIAKD